MDRTLQMLGLAKKAGLLAIGSQDTSASARAGKAYLIISAVDASDSALRRAKGSATSGRAIHVVVPYTSFEIGSIIGRGAPGTVAVLDAGLAAGFLRGLAATDPDRYREPAELLAVKAQAYNLARKTHSRQADKPGGKPTGAPASKPTSKRRTAQ